jgi:hypothetical protein
MAPKICCHSLKLLRHKGLLITSGFVQLGLDVEAIIGSAYPSFGFGGRNSAGLLLVNFSF